MSLKQKLSLWNWNKKEDEEETDPEMFKYQDLHTGNSQAKTIADLQKEMENFMGSMRARFSALNSTDFNSKYATFFKKGLWLKPQLDITADKSCYSVHIELPGMSLEDIDIELLGQTLVITGEKKQESQEEEKEVYRIERDYGAFKRTLNLPEDADPEKIDALYKNGILHVSIPRKAEPHIEGKKISVKLGD